MTSDDTYSKYLYQAATVTHNNAVTSWHTFKYYREPTDRELLYSTYATEKGVVCKILGRSLELFKDVAFKTFHLSIPIFKKLSFSVTFTLTYPKKTAPTPKSEQPK